MDVQACDTGFGGRLEGVVGGDVGAGERRVVRVPVEIAEADIDEPVGPLRRHCHSELVDESARHPGPDLAAEAFEIGFDPGVPPDGKIGIP